MDTAITLTAPAPKVAYRPTKRDWQILQAVQELIAESGRLSNGAIATKVGVTTEAVRKRLVTNPELRAWLNEQLEQATEEARAKVIARATELAIRGSIDHMNYLAKIGGWFKQPDASTGGQGGVTVVIRV